MEDKHPGLNEVIVPARRRQAGDPPPEGPGDTGGPAGGPGAPPRPGSGFDLNRPTIVAMLYLSALALGITGVVGVVLAYVWRSEQPDGWEASHYTYLIRGFWLWLAGCVVGILLLVVVIGVFILLAAFALIVIRAILSIIRAQNREPMPNPETWLA